MAPHDPPDKLPAVSTASPHSPTVAAVTPTPPRTSIPIWAALSALLFMAASVLIARAPIEKVMGPVQKIFYFHVPCAWVLLLSTLVAGFASISFLFKGSLKGNHTALAAAELGVLFGLAALVTGPLWGRVAWGKYWTWDARQTSTLLLWLVLCAYLLARKYGGPGAHKLAAALALFAAANVPLVYISVRIWRTLHPSNSVVPTLDPAMRPALYVSLFAFMGLWGILLAMRVRLESARAALAELQSHLDDQD
jgi:heme exporter protein C